MPFFSIAGMAMRRAWMKASPSSGSSVEKTSSAPFSSQIAVTCAISTPACSAGSSDWTMIIAAESRSSPMRVSSSTALIVGRSMNSSIDGRIDWVIARTAAVAESSVGNVATRVCGVRCAGTRRSVTSVMMPRVPSLPTNSFVRDRPATSLSRGPPSSMSRPSARTTFMPST